MATSDPERNGSFYRSLPVSVQWGLPFGVAILAVALLVVFVRSQSATTYSEAPITPAGLKAEKKIAQETMRQQQSPQVARVPAGKSAAAGLEHVISAWVNDGSKSGLSGPVTAATCAAVPHASSSDRVALACTVTAANVTYHFRGIVDPKLATATYCQKIEYPPVYQEPTVPLAPACL